MESSLDKDVLKNNRPVVNIGSVSKLRKWLLRNIIEHTEENKITNCLPICIHT